VAEDLKEQFHQWHKEQGSLSKVSIPILAFNSESEDCQLQLPTFCNSSKNAYAAAVFIRVETGEKVEIQLLKAKSRVAPMKNPTIPRLELLGCLIGARLRQTVRNSLQLNSFPQYFWTDSSVALAWISRNDEWGTFIGNRVKEINVLSSPVNWQHIPGESNPADLPSRGCSPVQLLQSRWWEGPAWLWKKIEDLPVEFLEVDEGLVNSEKKGFPNPSLYTMRNLPSLPGMLTDAPATTKTYGY